MVPITVADYPLFDRLPHVWVISSDPRVEPALRAATEGVCAQKTARVIASASDLPDPVEGGQTPGGLVILVEPPPSLPSEIEAITDAEHLPCWAVVVVSDSPLPGGPPRVPRNALDAATLAAAAESAQRQLDLRRECARARGDLLTVGRRVSHDLRTPLGAALSTSELLREVLSEDAPEHLPLAEAIFDAADEMMHLIERISFVLKAVAAPSARETVDAGWILLGAKERLQIRLQEAQVSIIEPPSWPRVRAAPAWLDAIWTHLLIYALQHACERPRFELGWVREPLQFWLDFPQAPGGPPPDQPVQPFHRLHELSGWMDLGLAIAQRLVELQGGRLTRQSASPGRVRLSFTLEGSPLE